MELSDISFSHDLDSIVDQRLQSHITTIHNYLTISHYEYHVSFLSWLLEP